MKLKRPRDSNQLAKFIVDRSVGEANEVDLDNGKDPKAVERGALGGKTGGRARAEALTPERRKAIARRAATARWARQK